MFTRDFIALRAFLGVEPERLCGLVGAFSPHRQGGLAVMLCAPCERFKEQACHLHRLSQPDVRRGRARAAIAWWGCYWLAPSIER